MSAQISLASRCLYAGTSSHPNRSDTDSDTGRSWYLAASPAGSAGACQLRGVYSNSRRAAEELRKDLKVVKMLVCT